MDYELWIMDLVAVCVCFLVVLRMAFSESRIYSVMSYEL
jgi:hypothetical protein